MAQNRNLPPINVNAEQALLGSVLIDPASLPAVRQIVEAIPGGHVAAFWEQRHQTIWKALTDLTDEGQPVDIITLPDRLGNHLADIGGDAYIIQLVNVVPSAIHARAYAELLAEYANRRAILDAGLRLAGAAYDNDANPLAEAARVQATLTTGLALTSRRRSITEVAAEFWDELGAWNDNPIEPGEVRGIPTGLKHLDTMLGGLEPALYFVAAASHIGKTAFCLALAKGACQAGHRVSLFSLEQTENRVMERLVCAMAKVDRSIMRTGRLTPDDWHRVAETEGEIAEWPLTVYGPDTNHMAQIEAECLATKPELILIDWCGLVQGSESDSQHNRLGDVARWAARLATDRDVLAPVVLPHQISSKTLAQRSSKVPTPADVYESDEPYHACDVFLGLHRDDAYTAVRGEWNHELQVVMWKDRPNGKAPARTELRFGWYGQIEDF